MVIIARPLIRAALVAGALGMTGCGHATASHTGTTVGIVERDFRITAPATIRSGTLTIRDTNRGPDTHELFVVREPGHGTLPLRKDGLTIDEDAIAHATAISTDGIEPGTHQDLRLHLAPGRYVLFCNMAGHYLGGMHARLIVQ